MDSLLPSSPLSLPPGRQTSLPLLQPHPQHLAITDGLKRGPLIPIPMPTQRVTLLPQTCPWVSGAYPWLEFSGPGSALSCRAWPPSFSAAAAQSLVESRCTYAAGALLLDRDPFSRYRFLRFSNAGGSRCPSEVCVSVSCSTVCVCVSGETRGNDADTGRQAASVGFRRRSGFEFCLHMG